MHIIKGWRTIIFNFMAAFFPLLDQYALGDHIPEKFMLPYVCFLVAGNLILRLYTSTPVGERE